MGLALQAQPSQQFGRVFQLVISTGQGAGIDLSQLHCKFAIKRSGIMTPNVADIRVYNADLAALGYQLKDFTKIVLQAGYASNYGVIFQGNIKQSFYGRESSTDTFIDFIAGDGDQAYNYSIVNTTIAKGSTQADHLNAAFASLAKNGVTQGYVNTVPVGASTPALPRGKVMYGTSRDYVRQIANSSNCVWSIQNQQIVYIPQASYLPGTAIVLSSKTGMIGTPQQTIDGINAKCLLNPGLKCHGRVQIDNKSIQQYKLNQFVPGSPANTPVPLTNDGFYYILVAEHEGDNRGLPWYTNLVCLGINPSSNPLNSVKGGYGGQ
jgi:hypothetical protein